MAENHSGEGFAVKNYKLFGGNNDGFFEYGQGFFIGKLFSRRMGYGKNRRLLRQGRFAREFLAFGF
jgi:hypothetical protein